MSVIVNVKDRGVIADGVTIVSPDVQRIVDELAACGGGTVLFSAGQYVLATVMLKSNIRIELEKGAVLLGALNASDYRPAEPLDFPLYQDASHCYFEPSMFAAIDCDNVAIVGPGLIDMRSVWDPEDAKDCSYRAAKPIAFKNCKNVEFADFRIENATDLAVYFAGCENVDIHGLSMRVYIDGISPDNSKQVRIRDCDIEAGDDGIVLKSSYTLNRTDVCKDIDIRNCRIKTRCNALKFGTESNGGFINIHAENLEIYDTRISAIALESVDGALIENVTVKNVTMINVNGPIFIHIGRRMRGPKHLEIGQIRNITLENITVKGPYKPYDIVPCYYWTWQQNDWRQYPWYYEGIHKSLTCEADVENPSEDNAEGLIWQFTSNICGLPESHLENITLRNIQMELDGGVQEYATDVPEDPQTYPEIFTYGRVLPAKGIFFRYLDGLTLDNVTVRTYRPDARPDFEFRGVTNLTRSVAPDFASETVKMK
ncbi:MAG: hypothetical protein IJ009_02715 [Clostridia bacterium]|nr:hypothetical protein [Clostridia bacterium]